MGNDDRIKQFPTKRVARSPEAVQRLKIEEEVLRDPRMQQQRIPTILKTISQVRWFKNVEQMTAVREHLPKTRVGLGELLAASDEGDWKSNPLYYWILCKDYLDKMTEERIASEDDPGDSDPPPRDKK